MSQQNTSAGVYTAENDLSQRGTPVLSSTGAIVVESAKGEVGIPIRVTDKSDLKDKFGIKDFAKYGFGLHCAEHFLAQSKSLYIVRAVDAETALTAGAYLSVDDPTAADPVIKLINFDGGSHNPQGVKGDPAKTIGFVKGTDGLGFVLGAFYATSPGEWSKQISIQIRPSAPPGTGIGEFSNVNHFYVDVFLNYGGSASLPVESFLCSRTVELDAEQQQMFIEDRINSNSKYIRFKNNSECPIIRHTHSCIERLDGGADGDRVKTHEIANAWDNFGDTEFLDVQIMINAGYCNESVHRRMVAIAAQRGDAIAVLDYAREFKLAARAIHYRRNILNISSSYGAMYGPWAKVKDDVSGRDIWVPPSGLVAAQYAYTDRVRAYYWAPAGLTRGQIKVLDLDAKYNVGDRNALDQAQINVIRKIPGRGFVIMGAETLQTHLSGFSNVNVRRLVNGLKTAIRKSAITSNFNPNDELERLKLKDMVDAYLRPIKSGRGVYAWETVCDERNNTPDVVANNDLKLDLILDAAIPGKRIHIGADIRNYGSSLSFNEN